MNRDMVVHVTPFEVHAAIMENNVLVEYHIERRNEVSVVGNIYKGKVGKVLPGMQSAFVDIGLDKNAFLYVTDFLEEFADLKDTIVDDDEPIKADSGRQGPEKKDTTPHTDKKSDGEQKKTDEAPESKKELPLEEPVRKDAEPVPGDTRARRSVDESEPKAAEKQVAAADGERTEERDSGAAPATEGKAAAKTERRKRGRGRKKSVPPKEAEAPSQPDQPSEQATSDQGKIHPETQLTQHLLEQETEQANGLEQAERSAELPLPGSEVHYDNGGRRSGGRRKRRKSQVSTDDPSANISSMLRQGQEIIVQVMKEPMALKSARITSHISIPGRMLVYMPTFNRVGVSRKIKEDKERRRLRSIIRTNMKNRSGGFIVRTASEGCSEADILKDMNFLLRTWETIQGKYAELSAPAPLYEEEDLVIRTLRDRLDETYNSIWVDDPDEYANIVEFIDRFMPEMLPNVKLYTRVQPIFDFFNLVPDIQKATKQKVWLRSGGFIVINHTEALIAIDVNTGKYVGKSNNFEDTIAKINLDAAREIIRQIRLRNLGGIIVMDFIDMQEKKNKRTVMDVIFNELKLDKSPSKVLPFNEFGLVIMTRKRTASALEKNISEACPMCGGSGYTKSVSTVCYDIYSQIERMQSSLSSREIVVRANPAVTTALKTDEKAVANQIKARFQRELVLIADPLLPIPTFDIATQ
ncbi:MAG: Rne/Rng family ribonuclease [Acidobacteria bacterium]|nr:Rne/Rng family ribonuclease [Acidobacteriota bacterium]